MFVDIALMSSESRRMLLWRHRLDRGLEALGLKKIKIF